MDRNSQHLSTEVDLSVSVVDLTASYLRPSRAFQEEILFLNHQQVTATPPRFRIFTNMKLESLAGKSRISDLSRAIGMMTFGVMASILALIKFQPLLNHFPESSSIINQVNTLKNKEDQYVYMWNQLRTLINESSVIVMGFNEKDALPSRFLQHYFGGEFGIPESWREVRSWNKTNQMAYLNNFATLIQHGYSDLLYGCLCDTILLFRETNGVRRHVLFSHLNENWGAFSTEVPNRTVDWGKWEVHFNSAGCTTEDLWWYLNHTNVSAIFTVTQQWLDHPKVLSLPLGVNTDAATKLSRDVSLQGQSMAINNRTELLLIALSDFQHRPFIAKNVIANFSGTIQNRYKDGSDYFKNLRQAKFTLCPSGLGWDTYRAWEACRNCRNAGKSILPALLYLSLSLSRER